MRKLLTLLVIVAAGAAFASPSMQLLLAGGDVVTLSGHSNSASNFGATSTASFMVDDNGNVYERDNGGSWVQIDTVTDWVRPTTSAPGTYEVRYTNATGDTAALSSTTAENTWHALSSGDWTITITDNTSVGAWETATFDLEIRATSSGNAISSGSYTLTAEWTV